MKVSQLINQLNKVNPDDDICALWWEKPSYDYDSDDENVLTKEAWTEICTEFDKWENAGTELSEWIADAVIGMTEVKE
jgi:hypothetical protein